MYHRASGIKRPFKWPALIILAAPDIVEEVALVGVLVTTLCAVSLVKLGVVVSAGRELVLATVRGGALVTTGPGAKESSGVGAVTLCLDVRMTGPGAKVRPGFTETPEGTAATKAASSVSASAAKSTLEPWAADVVRSCPIVEAMQKSCKVICALTTFMVTVRG
jgi:hypothetical protein